MISELAVILLFCTISDTRENEKTSDRLLFFRISVITFFQKTVEQNIQ